MIYKDFIMGQYIEDLSVCDQLIDFFDNNPDVVRGSFGAVESGEIDLDKKNSYDLGINANDNRQPLLAYKHELEHILNQYKKQYPMCDQGHAAWGMVEGYNIQKYPKGGGFPTWHFENAGLGRDIKRHLVFMTYLNTVNDGGETEFMYQNVGIQPEKGLTVIWPATWPFTHRGKTSNEIKYIATGWYSYV